MFAPRFFAPRYFGPRYFPPAIYGVVTVTVGGGYRFYPVGSEQELESLEARILREDEEIVMIVTAAVRAGILP